MSKYIFVTGGVLSGLGKGVSAASLGRLLKSRGYTIFVQKLDPYLNVDPGTMSPLEHGEVYVTKDGGETDLDLGHYERFIGTNFTKNSNTTSGQILSSVLNNERSGQYEGKTVQIIPHVTDKIESLITKAAEESKADFIITEVGGTVGDIESYSFIYALANFHNKNRDKTFFIHATYVPYMDASKEFKSKPTQHSIKELRQYGINPNMVLLRANKTPTEEIIDKVARATLLDKNSIIGVPNADNIYKVPQYLEEKKMAHSVLEHFGLPVNEPDLKEWNDFVKLIDENKEKEITVGMVGKYTAFEDAYMSIIEALKISAIYSKVSLNFKWVSSEILNDNNSEENLSEFDCVVILPGFGERGFDGKVAAAAYLRETEIPTLGICYGLQAMTVAQAKAVGYKDATSRENSEEGTPIIDIMRDKKMSDELGGTLRLGENETVVRKDTLAHKIYGSDSVFERHRHRFEVNPKYRNELEVNGFVFSGDSKQTGLAEIVEYSNHPFYIGVQYHPEFNANPLKEHPLFKALITEAIKNKK